MIRPLLPRIHWCSWSGATLTDPTTYTEDARGGCVVIQWLGLMIEIGAGRLHGLRPARQRTARSGRCRSCGEAAELDGGGECAWCAAW